MPPTFRIRTLLLTLCSFAAIACAASSAQTSKPMLAATPPMGWNSWNHFAEKVTDKTIRDTADAMVSSGMRDAGYIYVNIDDTWEGKRDAKGNIQPNEKFPDMKALADYVHSKGLRLGIYSSPGAKTCAGYEGSLGLKQQAGNDHEKAREVMQGVYSTMHEALARTGRPIVLSLCQYGWEAVWRWGQQAGGNLWRTTGDIEDNYASMSGIGFGQAGLSRFAGPGHWNDPDMLEIGNGGMTPDEYRSHMSLWSLLSAPLLAGNDIPAMTQITRDILLNREVIALDQDALGRQGDRVYTEGPLEVWSKPLADGSLAVGIFSRWRMPLTLDVPLTRLGLSASAPIHARDLWKHADLPPVTGSIHAQIPPHGVVLLRLHP
jgi:alpha-galactosidase